jgi:zinc protease
MRTRIYVIAAAACVLCFAQKEQPPEGGPPKPFHLAQPEDFRLANGMKVTLVPYGSVPRVAVRAFLAAGGVDETANQVWLSRLTGLLLKEGTKTRSAEELAQEAADDGAQIEIEPGVEFTSVGGVALSDRAAPFVTLVADVLKNPSLPETDVGRLKTDLGRELAVAKTQPDGMARARFLETLYPNSPYGHVFPSEQQLQGYTIEDARNFYRANYSPERTHLYVAGKLDPGLRSVIQAAFEGWPQAAQAARPEAHAAKARSFSMIDRPGAAQSTLYIGLPVADPTSADYVALDVTNALLGGSFASRITSNIREQKGYTYSPRSQIGARIHSAYWVETADVTTSVTGPSMHEIFSEIDRLRKEAPGAAELKGIETYLAGLFVLRNTSSPDAVIGQLHFVDSQGLPRSFLSDYVRKVMDVKTQDVQAMTEKYLSPDKMAIVVVGDKSKIAEQVKTYERASP